MKRAGLKIVAATRPPRMREPWLMRSGPRCASPLSAKRSKLSSDETSGRDKHAHGAYVAMVGGALGVCCIFHTGTWPRPRGGCRRTTFSARRRKNAWASRCKTPEIARASRRFPHISASQVLICGMRACWGEVSGVLPPRHRFLPPRPTARGGRCRRRVGELGGPGRLHARDPASAPVPDPRGGERSASRAGRPLSLLRGSPQTPRSARLVRLIADPAVGRSPSAGGSPNAVAGA